MDEKKVLRQLSSQEQELINSTNNFSIDLLKAEYELKNNENFMFSPVSVGMALGMIYNGVGEKEKNQIQNAMGLESLVEKEINKSYNELLNFLQLSNAHIDISYANSMWFSQDININEEFRTRVMAYYDAEITELNFKKSSAFDYINDWGAMKTNGHFDQLIQITPPKSSEIFLVNALSLNTNWSHQNSSFKSIREFYTAKEEVEVETINWNGLNVKLNDQDYYSYVEIPFENSQFLLSVIQPDEIESLDEIIASFTIEDLKDLAENSNDYNANVSLPEINFNSDNSMKSALSSIGLNGLFLPSADLSPSFMDRGKHISDINHLSKISLRRNSINSKTAISFEDSTLKLVQVNRPFFYFVHDKITNTVLFTGYYANPAK